MKEWKKRKNKKIWMKEKKCKLPGAYLNFYQNVESQEEYDNEWKSEGKKRIKNMN